MSHISLVAPHTTNPDGRYLVEVDGRTYRLVYRLWDPWLPFVCRGLSGWRPTTRWARSAADKQLRRFISRHFRLLASP